MNKDNARCLYLEATLEEDGAIVDPTKVCLFKLLKAQSKSPGFIAGRGLCPECDKFVTDGNFAGASVGSLTNPVLLKE